MPPERRTLRCAIYTRKSSEEGLEQSFNSLDAQREACVAYIQSQRHEGWKVLDAPYDDGGYSGGTLERPGLKELLADIDAGGVDVVVVYKVDRLTRSLADFAKIVERFDARGVGFVSVTQQFNTSTSMGRLTLNVLLSFAQFERELTGERIRDKIAASKRKGMWMGGCVPLGYDHKDRRLIVNDAEAELVRNIFRRYVELGCVAKLKAELDSQGITSKVRLSASGQRTGGTPFSRGALYTVLKNRLYLGQIAHRGQVHAGEHDAIVSLELWDEVQARLHANGQARRAGVKSKAPSLLAGLLYEEQGNRLTPSHAVKDGKRYRYYVSQALIQHRGDQAGCAKRIPAHDIEDLVLRRLQTFLGNPEELLNALAMPSDNATTQALVGNAKSCSNQSSKWTPAQARAELLAIVARITVRGGAIEILLDRLKLRAALIGAADPLTIVQDIRQPSSDTHAEEDLFPLTIEAQFRRVGGEVRLIVPAGSPHGRSAQPNPNLIRALTRAQDWYERLLTGQASCHSIAAETGCDERYVSRVVRCAFLTPDIVEALLEGRQPPELTLQKLLYRLPSDWTEQRRVLGFSAS